MVQSLKYWEDFFCKKKYSHPFLLSSHLLSQDKKVPTTNRTQINAYQSTMLGKARMLVQGSKMGGTLIGGPKDEDGNPDLEDGDKQAAVDLEEKPLQPGDHVEAKYRGRGRRYYKGTIKNVLPGDRYDVDYEDGDKDRGLSIEFIRRLPELSPSTAKAEDAVYAERQNDRSKVEVEENAALEEPALTMDPVDRRTGFKIGQKVEAKYKGRGRRYYKGTIVEECPMDCITLTMKMEIVIEICRLV